MNELVIDGVNVYSPIDGKMDAVIDALVEFYGEKYREIIEQRLADAKFLFVPNSFYRVDINKYYARKYDKALVDFMKQKHTRYDIRSFFMDLGVYNKEVEFDYKKTMVFMGLASKEPEIREACEQFISSRLNKEGVERQIKWYCEFFDQEGKELMECLSKIHQEEGQVRKPFIDWESEVRKVNGEVEDKRDALGLKCVKEHLDKLIDELTFSMDKTELRALAENAMRDEQDNGVSDPSQLYRRAIEEVMWWAEDDFVDDYLMTTCVLNEDLLSIYDILGDVDFEYLYLLSEFTQSWLVSKFKALGFNCGEDLEDYLDNSVIKNIFPFKEKKKELDKIELDKKMNYAMKNPYYKNAVKELSALSLTSGTLGLCQDLYAYMFLQGSTWAYVSDSLDNNLNIYRVCVCPWALNLCNSIFVHELGHIIDEASVVEEREDCFIINSGLCIGAVTKNKKDFDLNNLFEKESLDSSILTMIDKYKPLNELVNEYCAQQIASNLIEKGIQIGLSDNKADGYTPAVKLIAPFVEQFKEQIIECKMKGGITALERTMGKENVEELAKCCDEYLKLISEQVYQDYFFKVKLEEVCEKYNCNALEASTKEADWPEENLKDLEIFRRVYAIAQKVESVIKQL